MLVSRKRFQKSQEILLLTLNELEQRVKTLEEKNKEPEQVGPYKIVSGPSPVPKRENKLVSPDNTIDFLTTNATADKLGVSYKSLTNCMKSVNGHIEIERFKQSNRYAFRKTIVEDIAKEYNLPDNKRVPAPELVVRYIMLLKKQRN